MEEELDRYRAPALDKGLDILELLSEQEHGLTRGDIVKALGRKPNEIYRMVERLVARQYLTRSVGGDRYSLSLKLFSLAHRYPPVNRLIAEALPHMHTFAKTAEQSCHLAVYDEGSVVIVAQVDGPGVWGLSIRLGSRVSLLNTGSGHVLLAFQGEQQRNRMLSEHREVEGEIPMTAEAINRTLASVIELGHEEMDSLQTAGVFNVSFPILGSDGHAIAALTTPYLRRLDQRSAPSLHEVRSCLQRAATALSMTPPSPT